MLSATPLVLENGSALMTYITIANIAYETPFGVNWKHSLMVVSKQ
jgi:hypothetical protein